MIMMIAIAAAAAAAQPNEPMQQILVPYADLDLSQPADAARLKLRVKAAAGRICGNNEPVDVQVFLDMERCTQDVVARAKPQFTAVIAQAREAHTIKLSEAR